ncbi:MAG: branched-chain amino acid ABC transporter permease [Burkholderiaceae bacterium]|nr:branched-chain amino acid ABC transporter permease [Burkholderiaceae bacterium]
MEHPRSISAGTVAVLALAAVPFIPGAVDNYLFFYLFLVFVHITLAQSWNLVAGYTGQISLAQHAFFGVGGYTTAIISTTWLADGHFYFNPATMLASGIAAAIFAALIGIPLLSKLAGDYFALGTLGFGEIVRVALIKGGSVTGGSFGIAMSSEPFETLAPHYWVGLAFAVFATLLVWALIRSRAGLALMAIREDPLAASANGVNVLLYKVFAFATGGFLAGIAGSLYAFYVFAVSPGGFLSLNWTLYPILMTVMGGSGTILGPVIGAFVMTAVFSAANVWLPAAHPILSGGLIILVMLFMPDGILRMGGARRRKAAAAP